MLLLCLSASRIYNTFRIQPVAVKKNLGSCSISFLVHPGRSPGMLLLCLSASRIQLFRKRLSEKVHATIPKGIVGGFECSVLQRN